MFDESGGRPADVREEGKGSDVKKLRCRDKKVLRKGEVKLVTPQAGLSHLQCRCQGCRWLFDSWAPRAGSCSVHVTSGEGKGD